MDRFEFILKDELNFNFQLLSLLTDMERLAAVVLGYAQGGQPGGVRVLSIL